jgi:hypothetical protein
VTGWLINNELERRRKEAMRNDLRYFTGDCLEGLRKPRKNLRIVGLRAEI